MMGYHVKIRSLIIVATLATVFALSLTHSGLAQQPTPTAMPATTITTTNVASAPPCSTDEDPAGLTHARSLLADVEDGTFAFDDDAFYAFCRYVKSQVGQPGPASPRAEVDTSESPILWRFLLERPRDYRGRLVTVEGSLLAKNGFQVTGPGCEELGTLYQCELGDYGTRGICTVVVIEPPPQIAIRSRVRVRGYFIKVRAYETTGEEVGSGPLLVARMLEPVVKPAPANGHFAKSDRGPGIWLATGTGILAFIWLILRRRVRRPRRDRDNGLPSPGAPSSATDDFAWMSDTGDDQSRDREGAVGVQPCSRPTNQSSPSAAGGRRYYKT